MFNKFNVLILIPFLLMAIGCDKEKTDGKEEAQFKVPVEYYKLDNGLKVILSPDKTTPTVAVAVYYNIGFRVEPENRTGFAHLFEHMMFQGSKNLGKMEFVQLVQRNGGILNGSTRFDFTNYFEVVPAHKLETMLWAEADRMSGLDITQENLTNQQGVVKNEVKVNVLNQPYGGFPWLDMPQYANENWYNAHNFYGDLEDLDSANLADVKTFFDTYYAPNNAALAVVGDFEIEEAKTLIEKYYGSIPSAEVPPLPDLTEPKQTAEKIFEKEDKLATEPAYSMAYHMPKRNTPEYYAMGLIDQIMIQGDNSLLYKKLVKEKGYTDMVWGDINYLGNMFNYNGPMLWMFHFTHDNEITADSITTAVDDVINNLMETGISQELLDNALIKMRSRMYDEIADDFGVGRADFLCSFALFDDNPARINTLEAEFKKVTPELANKTLEEFLQKTNRTILTIKPLANRENL